ncbi:MAG: DNA methyltransferase [Phycisphaerae bacterium]
MPEPMKDLDNLKPIDHAVPAKPHTAVYKMHRYFARRPWSVFRALIEHYSNPGSIILDPFCGGGVTVVEGLRLGRKVIGVDLNPMATFITFCEVVDVDLGAAQAMMDRLTAEAGSRISDFYRTRCRSCGQSSHLLWTEYAKTYPCDACQRVIKVSECSNQGQCWRCPHCSGNVPVGKVPPVGLVPIRLKYKCRACRATSEVLPESADIQLIQRAEESLLALSPNVASFIPSDNLPRCNMERENSLHDKGILRFSDMFTRRNLLALCLLRHAIAEDDSADDRTRLLFEFTFSATIDYATNMSRVVQGAGREITTHSFWPPEQPCENNVWFCFEKRYKAVMNGKQYLSQSFTDGLVKWFARPKQEHDFNAAVEAPVVLTQSSHQLPLPAESVDVIITDPPYGSNVCYAELSNLWAVWIKERLQLDSLIDNRYEAIIDRRSNFQGAKNAAHYRKMMYDIFRECYRVLKRGRWMVMTFHNKQFRVWNTLHLAAHDAGFVLAEHDGVIYQPPIRSYTTTLHQKRGGSMLGDFILSFQKVEEAPEFKQIEHAEIGRHIERLAAEAVLHHRGASLSTIYMKLMPWLLNNNLLDKIGENEVLPYLQQNFEERDGLWKLKADPDQALREELKRYSHEHYKASYEELDFVPIDARIEYLIRRLLYGQGAATQDEILNQIYTNLINSNMAEVREIQRVLESIAKMVPLPKVGRAKRATAKGGRKVWRLREDIDRERLFKDMGADVQYRLASSEESDHDLAIARLVEIAGVREVKAHIGKTEQSKYTEFRHMSSDLPQRIKGLPKAARTIIEQIDVLWHNGGRGIVAAFEVERTTTITSGLQRFRDLLAAVPEVQIGLYLVIPKSRAAEVRRKLTSPANRKEGLDKKVGYVYLEDLQIQKRDPSVVDFEKIVHFVGEK